MVLRLTPMGEFRFEVLERRASSAAEWLERWAGLASPDEEEEYRSVMAATERNEPDCFIRVGQWKDKAYSPGRWKADVASVAWLVWEAAAAELARPAVVPDVQDFLESWSARKYDDKSAYVSGCRTFGTPRATTLLHFISGGRYHIVDARVKTAIQRLIGDAAPELTPATYLNFYCPITDRLAAECGTDDRRRLDNALFYYGAWEPKKLGL